MGEVHKRIKRRLRVARAPERTGEIARAQAQMGAVLTQKRLEQPQQGAPAFHLPAEIVHGLGIRLSRISNGGARFDEDVSGNAEQRVANREIGSQGWLVVHMTA